MSMPTDILAGAVAGLAVLVFFASCRRRLRPPQTEVSLQ